VLLYAGSDGAIDQQPWFEVPNKAEKHAAPSNRAEPIDGAIPANQGRRRAIADKPVVLNPQRMIDSYL
jgi:hypothetical protein